MKKFIFLFTTILLLTACSGEKTNTDEQNTDETDTYKISEGKITNEQLLINLAVRAENIIEKHDRIDGVTIEQSDINVEKQSDMKNTETGDIYKNIYYIDGQYVLQDKKYDFEWYASFDENNVDLGGKTLQYTSDMEDGEKINVDISPVE